jgi:hypothetical protein
LLVFTSFPRTLTLYGIGDEAALFAVGVSRLPNWFKYVALGAVVGIEAAVIINNHNLYRPAGFCGDSK